MLVGSDIDNVLCGIIDAAHETLADDLGIDPTQLEHTNLYHAPFVRLDKHQSQPIRLPHSFWSRPELLRRCRPLPGAAAAMKRLHASGMLGAYVTRRPPGDADLTHQWLLDHGFPIVPVQHVGTDSADTNYARCKSLACRDMGATHLIDDHADEIASATEAGIDVIVVDAPIGRTRRQEILARRPDIRIAADVSHAVDILLDLARKAA